MYDEYVIMYKSLQLSTIKSSYRNEIHMNLNTSFHFSKVIHYRPHDLKYDFKTIKIMKNIIHHL